MDLSKYHTTLEAMNPVGTLFCLLASAVVGAAAPLPAFPGAEGFGRFAEGGRGGDVYLVTTLNDSGPGSLREGIRSAPGPRTILFRVSGTITLESQLVLNRPHLTIAGQSAPGDGITLRNYTLVVKADHAVVRFIRSRLGDLTHQGNQGDAIGIGHGSNIIIDHCSASWSIDETLSGQSDTVDLLTVQWCLVAESLHHSTHPKGPHGMGGIMGAVQQSYHHNLFAHHNARNPKVSWRRHCDVDFRNNVIYNWGAESCYDGTFAKVNWVNNYYKAGPATNPNVTRRIFRILHQVGPGFGDPGNTDVAAFYLAGNYVAGFPAITADNWAGGVDFGKGTSEAANRVRTPFPYPVISYESSPPEAYDAVLAATGASLARDAVDERVIKEVRTGTATFGRNGIIGSQTDVGGWPALRSTAAPADTDGDGMPDVWEKAHGLNPDDPSDRNLDRTGDGYTNLEKYLNELAAPAFPPSRPTPGQPRRVSGK